MKLFLSWSKDTSKQHAKAFGDWIKNVIQNVDPFFSEQDISLGQRGIEEIEKRLSDYSFGILFVTQENKSSPWLLYEAGALSRSVDGGSSRIIPVLIDVTREELVGSPLSHFQNAASFDEEAVFDICRSINEQNMSRLDEERLRATFEKWWPDLSKKIDKIPKSKLTKKSDSIEDMSAGLKTLTREIVALRENEQIQNEALRKIETYLAPSIGRGVVRPGISDADLSSFLFDTPSHESALTRIGRSLREGAVDVRAQDQNGIQTGKTGGHSDATD